MHLTGDVSLGTILTIVTLIAIAVNLGRRIGAFEGTLKYHATTMSEHSTRLTMQETRIIDLVASVQRLIGRMEVTAHEHRRETDPR